MLINSVVVNASPLICLFKSGLVDLFPALFKDVVVPEAVINEVMAKGKADFAAPTLISNSWMRKIGATARKRGTLIRFIDVVQQLDLTHDLYSNRGRSSRSSAARIRRMAPRQSPMARKMNL
jgi:hypothetical protein